MLLMLGPWELTQRLHCPSPIADAIEAFAAGEVQIGQGKFFDRPVAALGTAFTSPAWAASLGESRKQRASTCLMQQRRRFQAKLCNALAGEKATRAAEQQSSSPQRPQHSTSPSL